MKTLTVCRQDGRSRRCAEQVVVHDRMSALERDVLCNLWRSDIRGVFFDYRQVMRAWIFFHLFEQSV